MRNEQMVRWFARRWPKKGGGAGSDGTRVPCCMCDAGEAKRQVGAVYVERYAA